MSETGRFSGNAHFNAHDLEVLSSMSKSRAE
jgi:hypothetical protein